MLDEMLPISKVELSNLNHVNTASLLTVNTAFHQSIMHYRCSTDGLYTITSVIRCIGECGSIHRHETVSQQDTTQGSTEAALRILHWLGLFCYVCRAV